MKFFRSGVIRKSRVGDKVGGKEGGGGGYG